MTSKEQLKSRLHLSTASFLIAAMGSFGTASAYAQDAADSDTEEMEVEEVVVTGSRIKRAGFDTVQPATVVDSEFIDLRGLNNVADALNQIPQFGLPDESNAGGQNSLNVGQNIVNLFGLGAQRTLSVINGRRIVGSNAPTVGGATGLNGTGGPGLQVDLNIIPTAIIERVETIETGGAPIYGSDAIAGTVNFILKDDFEGFTLDGQYGMTEHGDGDNYRIRSTFGGNFGDDRGNAVVSFEWNNIERVDASARPELINSPSFFANPLNTGPSDGIVDSIFTDDALNVWQVPTTGFILFANSGVDGRPGDGSFLRNRSGCTTVTEAYTRYDGAQLAVGDLDCPQILPTDAAGNHLMLDFGGGLITLNDANLGIPTPARTSFFSSGADGANNPYVLELDETNTLISPVERYSMFSKAHYDVTDNIRFFYEGLYSRSSSVDTSNQPPWSTVFFGNANNGSLGTYRINIAENPYVTTQMRDVIDANVALNPDLDAPEYFYVARANNDLIGDSPNFRSQDVFRIVGGLEGEFELAGRDWSWDLTYNFGQTNASLEQSVIDGERLSYMTDVVVNPATGLPDCRINVEGTDNAADNGGLPANGTDFSAAGCTPLNILVFGSVTEEQQDYLIQRQFQSTQIQQSVFDANIVGELFDLPAGSIGFAAGVTHRRESGNFRVGQGTKRGISPNSPQADLFGDFKTNEVYAEVLLPIVSGSEGLGDAVGSIIENFEIEFAGRMVDNNIAGSDPTWTVGGRLTPALLDGAFTFRGNYTEAIRSPSIVELFLPQQLVGTFATDPCDERDIESGNAPATRRANCQAQVADLQSQGLLPTDFNLDTFRAISRNASQSAITGGNPNLSNEKSKAWSIGVILRPEQIPGLSLSVDWTDITISDAIVNLSATNIMAACFDSANFPNEPSCSQFERQTGTFQPINFVTGFTNAAARNFEGMSIQAQYAFDLADIASSMDGQINLSTNVFYTHKDSQQVGSGDLNNFAGERSAQSWRWQSNIVYSTEKFTAFLQWRHESGGKFDVDDPEEQRDIQGFPGMDLFNMGFRYQVNDTMHMRLNIDNVLDRGENALRMSSAGSNSNVFDDALGRRFTFGVGFDF